MLWLSTLAVACRSLAPPCAPTHAELLRAVLSKLPTGVAVTQAQLKTMMGVHAVDLCGRPLKEVSAASPGGWARALEAELGVGEGPGALPVPPPRWVDPRPPPPPLTRCLGTSFPLPACTTWVTNEPGAADDLVGRCGFEAAPHLGLDLEWTPTLVKGQPTAVGLLQLASRSHCLLVRVGEMRQLRAEGGEGGEQAPLSPRLSALLAAPTPLKLGRGIRGDAKLLRALGCDVGGATELPMRRESLKAMGRSVAWLVPPKGKWNTNWDARELSDESLRYAAWDAVAACAVYDALPPSARSPGQRAVRKAAGSPVAAARPRARPRGRPQARRLAK